MILVKEKISVPCSQKDKVKELVGRWGWSVGKPYRIAFMAVGITCSFEKEFRDIKEYNEHSVEMDSQFVSELLSVGLSKDFIEKNKRLIVPHEQPQDNAENLMTWRKWREQRHR